MKYFFCLLSAIVLFSCSNSSTENSDNTSPVKSDTLVSDSGTSSVSFDEKEFKKLGLPFVIDTAFIQKVDTNDRITYQQVRQLGSTMLDLEFTGLEYIIDGFCKIDSLKQEGKYQEYIDKLDIGMLKEAIAYKVGYIELGKGSKLFIWGANQSSYEACPYFSGTKIIGTFVNSKNENTHFLLGEISGSGDPPATLMEQTSARIENGTIKIHSLATRDDLDVPGNEITEYNIELKMEGDKLSVFDKKKKSNNTESENP